jgi:hypothetical protein
MLLLLIAIYLAIIALEVPSLRPNRPPLPSGSILVSDSPLE